MIIHDVEWSQTIHAIGYGIRHPHATYLIEWDDGESYEGTFFSASESDNSVELGIEEDDPRYDEFQDCTYEITRIIGDGGRRYHEFITIDYRDFPDRIVDVTNGVSVYPNGETPSE